MPPEPELPEISPPPPLPPVPPPHSTLVTRSMTLVPVRGARDGEPVVPAALPPPPEVDGLLAARSVSPLMRFDSSALARSTTPWLVMMVVMSPRSRVHDRMHNTATEMARHRHCHRSRSRVGDGASDAPSTLKTARRGTFTRALRRRYPRGGVRSALGN